MSSFLLQFRELDPKTGVIPATFQGLAGIGARARAMLENRTAEQIGQAASAVDWAIDEQVRDWEEEERARVGDEVFSRSSYGFRDDLVSALQQYFNSYGVDIDPELTHCGWEDYEYFAALSLWLLADSVTWIKQRPLTGRSVYADGRVELFRGYSEKTALSIAGGYAIQAMEAVCYAEQLRVLHGWRTAMESQIKRQVKKKQSENARRAALKRHKESRRYQAEAIAMWEEQEWKSIEAAARHIAKHIPITHRTITKWISDHRRLHFASRVCS